MAISQSNVKQPIAGLPRGVSCRPNFSGSGVKYWRIRLGKRFTGGEVILRDFRKLDDARTWVFGDEASEFKAPSGILKTVDLAKGEFRRSDFEWTPKRLDEAAAAIRAAEAQGTTLNDALKLSQKFSPTDKGVFSFQRATELCAEAKKQLNRATDTLYSLKTRWRAFNNYLPKEKSAGIHLIESADIKAFIKSKQLSPIAARNVVRPLSSLFSWCVAEGILRSNPAEGWDYSEARKALARDREPRIYTIEEAKRILQMAVDGLPEPVMIGGQLIMVEPGEMIPYVTIGMFAGIRPKEIRRLDWKYFWWGENTTENHDAHIDLPSTITKGRQGRTVPFEPILQEWLRPFRKDSGRVVPDSFERKVKAFSKAVWGEDGWPQDIARHSYASYLLARDKDSGAVAENLGHRDTRDTLFRYYRRGVKLKADVTAYWGLSPRGFRESTAHRNA